MITENHALLGYGFTVSCDNFASEPVYTFDGVKYSGSDGRARMEQAIFAAAGLVTEQETVSLSDLKKNDWVTVTFSDVEVSSTAAGLVTFELSTGGYTSVCKDMGTGVEVTRPKFNIKVMADKFRSGQIYVHSWRNTVAFVQVDHHSPLGVKLVSVRGCDITVTVLRSPDEWDLEFDPSDLRK
jgi:hypothetical protein